MVGSTHRMRMHDHKLEREWVRAKGAWQPLYNVRNLFITIPFCGYISNSWSARLVGPHIYIRNNRLRALPFALLLLHIHSDRWAAYSLRNNYAVLEANVLECRVSNRYFTAVFAQCRLQSSWSRKAHCNPHWERGGQAERGRAWNLVEIMGEFTLDWIITAWFFCCKVSRKKATL